MLIDLWELSVKSEGIQKGLSVEGQSTLSIGDTVS